MLIFDDFDIIRNCIDNNQLLVILPLAIIFGLNRGKSRILSYMKILKGVMYGIL